MKIGIAGYGYVGKAHATILGDYHDIIVSDPGLKEYGDLRHAEAVIVCVSTPSREDGGCHMDNVFDVIDSVGDVPILIKSTISVEGWRMLADLKRNITYSPEFVIDLFSQLNLTLCSRRLSPSCFQYALSLDFWGQYRRHFGEN